MKYWIVIIAALFLTSCKTKAGMVNTNSVTPYVVDENELTAKKLLKITTTIKEIFPRYTYVPAPNTETTDNRKTFRLKSKSKRRKDLG